MFAQFIIDEFPIVYIQIQSQYFNDESFEIYKSSFIHLLLRAKSEKQKMIVLLDLIGCDGATFKMENVLKQAAFYKSIVHHALLYVQHVYIISNRNDLHMLIKIFRTFSKSLVPYKVVKDMEKIEKNIQKKYGVKVDLQSYSHHALNVNRLIPSYFFDKDDIQEMQITPPSPTNIDININIEEGEEDGEEEEEEDE